jgi:hypothetical protein
VLCAARGKDLKHYEVRDRLAARLDNEQLPDTLISRAADGELTIRPASPAPRPAGVVIGTRMIDSGRNLHDAREQDHRAR